MISEQYIKPELLLLIPVLWVIGKILKTTPGVQDWLIPYLLMGISLLLCGLWVMAAEGVSLASAFTAITQGLLLAGASVGGNQLVRQAEKRSTEDKNDYKRD